MEYLQILFSLKKIIKKLKEIADSIEIFILEIAKVPAYLRDRGNIMSRATGDAIRAFQKQQEEVQAIKATLYNYKEDHELLTNVASLVVEMLVSNYKDIYEFIEVCPHIVPQNRPVIQRRAITTLIENEFGAEGVLFLSKHMNDCLSETVSQLKRKK